jgi:glycosyltransferase involved in cell wall biosynthesis
VNSFPTKKNLLVIASTYPRWLGDHEPGFVHELSKRLTDKFNVIVICPHATGAKKSEVLEGVSVYRYRYAPADLETLVNDGGIVTNLKKSPWKVFLLPLFFIAQLICVRKVINNSNIDVVHAHWLIPQGLTLSVLSLFMKLPPFLVTSHGADLFALRGRFFNTLKAFVTKKASKISVVSKVMKSELSILGVADNKIDIMPMGVDMNNFTLNPEIIRSNNEILFVGRLVEKKGLCYLLSALPYIIAQHPNTFLTIIGFGPEEKALRAQSSHLNIEAKVNFIGAVKHENLAKYYQRASVFVAPFVESKSGDQEGLGLVLVEALSCGCPLVVSNIPACEDVISCIERANVFPAGNISLLAKAVCSSLEDSANQHDERDQATLNNKFSWYNVASNYEQALNKLTL